MAKYHINGKGVSDQCGATVGSCPFGGESGVENHYDSLEAAQAAYEEQQKDSLFPSQGKGSPLSSGGKLSPEDSEKVSSLRGLHSLGKARRAERFNKAYDKLLESWGPRGFSKTSDLTQDERDIADVNLERVNRYLLDENGDAVRPYSELIGYSPTIKGSKGIFLRHDLKFDHEDGNIYGVTEVSAPGPGFSWSIIAAVKVKNYGNDLELAIRDSQAEVDAQLGKLVDDSSGKIQYSEYPWKDRELQEDSVREHEEDALVNRENLIRKNLAKSILQAKEWSRLKTEKSLLLQEDKELISESGY